MKILYFLEQLRCPAMDEIMLLITRLGEETAFLVAALILFWCVDKRKGYYILAVGFFGTMLNQFLKLSFRIPRPWVLDPDFAVVEGAVEAAAGYSFPSGHSQVSVGTFGAIATGSRNLWVRTLCIAAAVLVPFSRMYLGVHTLWDVLIGSCLALMLVALLRPMLSGSGQVSMKRVLALLLGCALVLLAYVELWPFPEDIDIHNLESGLKNAYTMVGSLIGMTTVYMAEQKYVNFDTKAIWWVQILKVMLGLGLVLAVKEGLREPLEAIAGVYAGRAVRYFLIVVTAGLLWPMTFRWFSKIGAKR